MLGGKDLLQREGYNATLVGKKLFVFGDCGKSSDVNDETQAERVLEGNNRLRTKTEKLTKSERSSQRENICESIMCVFLLLFCICRHKDL